MRAQEFFTKKIFLFLWWKLFKKIFLTQIFFVSSPNLSQTHENDCLDSSKMPVIIDCWDFWAIGKSYFCYVEQKGNMLIKGALKHAHFFKFLLLMINWKGCHVHIFIAQRSHQSIITGILFGPMPSIFRAFEINLENRQKIFKWEIFFHIIFTKKIIDIFFS